MTSEAGEGCRAEARRA